LLWTEKRRLRNDLTPLLKCVRQSGQAGNFLVMKNIFLDMKIFFLDMKNNFLVMKNNFSRHENGCPCEAGWPGLANRAAWFTCDENFKLPLDFF
jgi:hypothetical protein